MVSYVIRRIGQSLIVLVFVTLMVFFTMHAIPGDPVAIFLGPSATVEQIEHYTKILGLDQPVFIQYFKWLTGLFQGEMGRSIALAKDVVEILPTRINVTLAITFPALVISTIAGVSLGIWAAIRRGKIADSAISVFSNISIAAPAFWIGILLVYIFSLKLGWLPVQGYTPLSQDFSMGIKKLIMPVLVLSLGRVAGFARQTRSAMLEVIGQDYIRTARSKGLNENNVILRHALRNAIIPVVTLMGMSVSGLIGGTVLIEQLFVIPGVGSLLMTAIMNKDYMVVQNIVFVIALMVLSCNLIVDILYGYIDPRIRLERSK